MTETPLISVVMNVRNGEKYLGEAIRSILDQSYRHFEFIIINDGSTDGTRSILDRLQAADERLEVFHQKPKGIYYSANRGCRIAKGKYIARFDADDISFPERLEQQVTFLEAHPKIAVLGTAIIRIDESGTPYKTYTPPTEPSQVKAAISCWDAIVQPTVMMRKDNFLAVNGYREIYELAGDWDLWIRMSEQFEIANLPEPLIYWRTHANEVTNSDVRKHTIYSLIAQRAAGIRTKTGRDPLENVDAVSPELLRQLGISERRIQKGLIEGYYLRAHSMLNAGKSENARYFFDQMLAECSSNILRKRIASLFGEAYINAYKNKGQFVRNCMIFCWAVFAKLSYVGVLLRMKSRFYYLNRTAMRNQNQLGKTEKRPTHCSQK